MVKQFRKKTTRKNRKSNSRFSKKMFGGDFTDDDKKELRNKGFTDQDIVILSNIPVGLTIIKMSLQQINPQTGNKFTPAEIMDSINTTQNEINNTNNTTFGGKTRRRKNNRRKSRKQRGGMCFGNGVGANNYDPNFSIYNTRELSLFPYRPTK